MFKIVRLKEPNTDPPVYESGWAGGVNSVNYIVDEWTTAPTGGLLVYEDFFIASFMLKQIHCPNFFLFACDVEEQMWLPPTRLMCPDNMSPAEVKKIWTKTGYYTTYSKIATPLNAVLRRKRSETAGWPMGTGSYKKIMLTGPPLDESMRLTISPLVTI